MVAGWDIELVRDEAQTVICRNLCETFPISAQYYFLIRRLILLKCLLNNPQHATGPRKTAMAKQYENHERLVFNASTRGAVSFLLMRHLRLRAS